MDEGSAATTMAAAQRGNKARKQAKEEKAAATSVAASVRGRNARKEQKQQQASAVAIQSRIRGGKARSRAPGSTGQRFYTPAEVAGHDRADDLWVTFFHKVYDLTSLVTENPGHLVQPLIDAAGTDITHWFDSDTQNLCKYVDPETELETYYLPMGPLLHAAPPEPTSSWSTDIGTPWWKRKDLCIGKLTLKTRKIKLLNMLSRQETILEVCSEETLLEIQTRYKPYNEHAASYTWKRTDTNVGRVLDMMATLDENGIPDETVAFDTLDIDEDFYVPVIHLYFSDDLTIA